MKNKPNLIFDDPILEHADKEKSYTCASCGKTLERETDEEKKEMLKEKEDVWGDVPMDKMAVVCDDCFNKMGLKEGDREETLDNFVDSLTDDEKDRKWRDLLDTGNAPRPRTGSN